MTTGLPRKTIRVWFTDFWAGFQLEKFHLLALLRETYDVVVTDRDPELLVYSIFGNDYLNYDCVRLYYTNESLVPDFNLCDYALGFHYLDFGKRYLRMPYSWVYIDGAAGPAAGTGLSDSELLERKFCSTVVSNVRFADPMRDNFISLLSEYKTVDSGGRYRNNVGGPVADKIAFTSGYKFSLCFENTSTPGYVTEKLIEGFNAHTVPIYWGDDTVDLDIDPASFVWLRSDGDVNEAVRRVIALDNDPELYLRTVRTPWLKPDGPYHGNGLRDFMIDIVENGTRQRCRYGHTQLYEYNRKNMVYRTETKWYVKMVHKAKKRIRKIFCK